MRAPRCTVHAQVESHVFRCGTPEDHEGYEHAEDYSDIEYALEDARTGDGGEVFDCDGDRVHTVELPTDNEEIVLYTFGSMSNVSNNHLSFILIPEANVDPEEVEAAIASIRNTTI